ncbi:MAG TPA: hypothetical protein VHR47_03800 [Bacillota bacterium]|nr:hypothetical protein [Bacillota bacterium]
MPRIRHPVFRHIRMPVSLKYLRSMVSSKNQQNKSNPLEQYFDRTLKTTPSPELEKDLDWVYTVCTFWNLLSKDIIIQVKENDFSWPSDITPSFITKYWHAGRIFMRACELRGISSTPLYRFNQKLEAIASASSRSQCQKAVSDILKFRSAIDEILNRLTIKLELESDGLIPGLSLHKSLNFYNLRPLERKIIEVFLEIKYPLSTDRLAEEMKHKNNSYFRLALATLVDRQILINRHPNYEFNPRYNFLFAQIKYLKNESQTR